jgi:hypothetical protein
MMRLSARMNRRLARLRELWDEAEYGRKRMLEVRTGHVYTEETRRRLAQAEIKHLKALFTLDAVGCPPDGRRDPLDAPHQDRRDDRPSFE